jgi:urea carboxylase-associated protein 2
MMEPTLNAESHMHDIPSGMVRWREVVLGGASWSHVLKRGTTLRLLDPVGGANVGAMFYNFELLSERYNMPDTLKAQHVAFLTSGRALYSDMGRILVSISNDTSGWHDTICGHSNPVAVTKKFGASSYQQDRNARYRNARDSFLVELGKYGLGARDITANVNFFSKVVVKNDGSLSFDPSHAKAGAYVDVRAEMNTLVVLNTCPHPLDPKTKYEPAPVHLAIWESGPVAADDPVRMFRPENARGFTNTERYFL